MEIECVAEQRCFAETVARYRHLSRVCQTPMRFAVYLPDQAKRQSLPVLYYLAGLTCTEETFLIKAGAERLAAELGIILVAPDTSPREARLPNDDADWDFGIGAGFYLRSTQAPWAQHYQMYDYVTEELPQLVAEQFGADTSRASIMGHSMGGHGALICALREPSRYRSVSAFAPVSAPSQSPWGKKAFTNFLGGDTDTWAPWDASQLVLRQQFPGEIWIDQGLDDPFLTAQLCPEIFSAACTQAGQKLRYREHAGYDHSYYFISSFVEEHLRMHAAALTDEIRLRC